MTIKQKYNEAYKKYARRSKYYNITPKAPTKQPTQASIRQLEREQTKLSEYAKQQRIETRKRAYDVAEDVNNYLETASSIYGGNGIYTAFINRLIMSLPVNYKLPESGDKNRYYKISEEYNKNRPEELFRYIEFIQIPKGEAEYIVDLISELDWSTPENYEKRLDNIHKKAFDTLTKDYEARDQYKDYAQILDILETIMNSSAIWAILNREFSDSDQRKAAHKAMYTSMTQIAQMAIKNGRYTAFDKVTSMIENTDSYNRILEYIDDVLYSGIM